MRLFNKKKGESCLPYSEIVEQYLSALYQTAYRLVANQVEAEYLVQNLFIELQSRSEELRRAKQPLVWLNKQLYRMFVDHRRHVSRASMVPDSMLEVAENRTDFFHPTEMVDGLKSSAEINELISQLQTGLNHLNEEERILIVLHEMESYDIAEIQEITGMPFGTIQIKLFRARTQLRKLMKQSISP